MFYMYCKCNSIYISWSKRTHQTKVVVEIESQTMFSKYLFIVSSDASDNYLNWTSLVYV
jgi:hypothetical protein